MMKNVHSVLCLACILLVASCAGKPTPLPQPSAEPQVKAGTEPPPAEKADLACSYFYFLWGNHAEYYQRFDDALEAYDKAIICDPDADYVMKKIPLVMIKQGDNAKATEWLEKTIQEHPADSSLYLLLAHLKILDDKPEVAVRLYNEALKHEPGNQVILLRLGQLHAEMKHFREAEVIFRKLLRDDNSLYFGHVYLARLLLQIRDFTGASQEFERALELNWTAELAYEMADFYIKHEQFAKAAKLFNSIIETDDTDERAVLGLAQTLLLMGRDQEAIDELNRLRTASETPERIDLVIARILLRTGKNQQAKDLLTRVAGEYDSSEARYTLALIAVQEGDIDTAIDNLLLIEPDDNEFEEAVYLHTRILREAGRIDELLALLRKTIADPNRRKPLFYVLLASLYEEKNEIDTAINLLNNALDLFPNDQQILFESAILLDKKGRQEEAIARMEQILEQYPDHPEALNYIGYTWADRNINLDKALAYIKKAVELKPDNGYILDSLGWVYYRLGRFDEAREQLEKAVQLAPDDPNIYDHLGDVYVSLKDFDKARKAYGKAIGLFEDDERKTALRKKIDELPGKN
jgi:tetratricopeptide (TPR) repeat protein